LRGAPAARLARGAKLLTGNPLRACLDHEWRGNVRELRSAVEQALLLASGPEITTAALLRRADDGTEPAAAPGADNGSTRSFREAKEQTVARFERDFLLAALRRSSGNITRAADEVGMYRQSFQQKRGELGIT